MATMQFDPDHVMVSEKPDGTFTDDMTNVVMKEIAQNSLVMQLGTYVEMDRKQEAEFYFQTDGVSAYWVDEGQKIKTDKPKFAKATMRAKKLGIILPASREYLHYKWSDFFEVMKPQIVEAFQKKFDQAAILGQDNPFEFSVEKATSDADNVVNDHIDYESILELEDKLFDVGMEPKAFISSSRNHSTLRTKAVSDDGVSLYDRNVRQIDGLPTINWDEINKGTLYTGDFREMRYGIPYNIHFEVSKEATLSTIVNDDDTPVNLFEQELVALRATMDVAFMTVKDDAFAKLKKTYTQTELEALTIPEIKAILDNERIAYDDEDKNGLIALYLGG